MKEADFHENRLNSFQETETVIETSFSTSLTLTTRETPESSLLQSVRVNRSIRFREHLHLDLKVRDFLAVKLLPQMMSLDLMSKKPD